MAGVIGKLKELSDSSDSIKDIHTQIAELRTDVDGLRDSIGQLRVEAKALRESLFMVGGEIRNGAEALRDDVGAKTTELSDELMKLKLVSSTLQGKVSEKVDSEIVGLVAVLKERMGPYVDAEAQLRAVLEAVGQLKAEINRMAEIGKGLRKEDFSMQRTHSIIK